MSGSQTLKPRIKPKPPQRHSTTTIEHCDNTDGEDASSFRNRNKLVSDSGMLLCTPNRIFTFSVRNRRIFRVLIIPSRVLMMFPMVSIFFRRDSLTSRQKPFGTRSRYEIRRRRGFAVGNYAREKDFGKNTQSFDIVFD